MDCPDSCALDVTVADGHVERIGPGRGHPDTAGFICTKIARFGRRMYHEDRILFPQRRTGAKGSGSFERVSWDDAIAEITDRFREIGRDFGGEAILPYHYGGSNGQLTDGFVDELYFAKLGASRLAKTICAVPTTLVASGMYGKMPGVAFSDYTEAECIVVWGANPKTSNIHLVPYLKAAKRSGAFVIVVDPSRNFSPQEADLHVPVMPGTDLPLALALIEFWRAAGMLDSAFLEQHACDVDVLLAAAEGWSLERAAAATGVDVESIRIFAEEYAKANPAVIRCGWGPERNRNGGQAIAAILALPALLGKFGVRGGGYTMSNRATKIDRDAVFEMPVWETRVINMTQLGDALNDELDPAVRGLFVYNSNPAVTTPDQNRVLQGLARDDLFTVVFDQVQTDTAQYADIVLPATTFLEHWDVNISYGSYVVGGTRPVVAPQGEARSNMEVFGALGRAMGWTEEPFQWDAETCIGKMADAMSLDGAPADRALLEGGRIQQVFPSGTNPIQFGTVFPRTPDGRIHLAPRALGENPYAYDPIDVGEYALALVSPASGKMITSTLGEFNFPELYVDLHRDDAKARNVSDDDQVRVYNDLGEVICRARVRDRVRPGVVSMPKGAWRKSSANGMTATALCPADVSEIGGAACFNDARVEVELAGSAKA